MDVKVYLEQLFRRRVDLSSRIRSIHASVTPFCARPLMPRDSRVYVEDILAAARKIRTYTSGMSRESFAADEKTGAVVRNLEVIGEAARSLPEAVREKAHGIDWRNGRWVFATS